MQHKKEHELEPVPRFPDLVQCKVCGAAEGELLSYCPGYKLNTETLEACYRGNVLDFAFRVYFMRVVQERCVDDV